MVTFVWYIRKKISNFFSCLSQLKKMCKGVAVENTHNAVLNENTAQYIGFEPFTWNKQTRPGITQSLTISNVATSIEVMETATSIRCIVSSNELNDVIRISSIKPGKTNNCQEEKKKGGHRRPFVLHTFAYYRQGKYSRTHQISDSALTT